MNLFHYSPVLAICGALVACGGSQKPAVEPGVAPAPEVAAPAAAPAETAVAPQADLTDPINRYSYALGMDLGKAVANISVPINMVVLMDALKDQVDSNRAVRMDDSTAEQSLQNLLLLMQQKKEADDKAEAQKALEEQAQFLSKNSLDTTVKMTTKGVQYKVITEGTGITPKSSDKVQVNYKGSLLDGTEFDNSFKRGEPLEFPVSAVIEGWQDLLVNMKEGMKVQAWIPSALAYGEAGVPPMIPANALLVFEVELLKVYAEVPPEAADGAAPAAEQPAAQPAAPAAEAKPAEAPKADAQKPAEKPAGKK